MADEVYEGAIGIDLGTLPVLCEPTAAAGYQFYILRTLEY